MKRVVHLTTLYQLSYYLCRFEYYPTHLCVTQVLILDSKKFHIFYQALLSCFMRRDSGTKVNKFQIITLLCATAVYTSATISLKVACANIRFLGYVLFLWFRSSTVWEVTVIQKYLTRIGWLLQLQIHIQILSQGHTSVQIYHWGYCLAATCRWLSISEMKYVSEYM